jgi:hypothetical protein
VDEQIAATMEQRLAPVTGCAQPMQEQVADLQQRVGENDRDTLELVLAIGQLCLQTAERLAGGTAPAPMDALASESVSAIAVELPKADQAKTPWRIPLVSSFFFVSGGLLLLHYL